jgi:hypothetical protein
MRYIYIYPCSQYLSSFDCEFYSWGIFTSTPVVNTSHHLGLIVSFTHYEVYLHYPSSQYLSSFDCEFYSLWGIFTSTPVVNTSHHLIVSFTHYEVYLIQHQIKDWLFSLRTAVSSTDKTSHRDMPEIVLYVVLSTTHDPIAILCNTT